jgi:hypothetical protein
MRKLIVLTLCSLTLVIGFVYAQEEGAERKPKATKEPLAQKTIVYKTRSTPVAQLAETLAEVFEGSDVRIVAEPVSNLLVIRAHSETAKEVLTILNEIDQPAHTLRIELLLLKTLGQDVDTTLLTGPSKDVAENIGELESNGKLFVANRMELSVIENQQAMLQVGETVPVVTGSSYFGGSRTPVNTYQQRSVGTLLSVTAAASKQGIAMNLTFEKSEIVPAKPAEDDEAPTPDRTSTLTQQSTVHVQDGHSTLVGTLVGQSGEQSNGAFLVIGAELREEAGPLVSFRSFSRRAPLDRSRASSASRSGTSSSRSSAASSRPSRSSSSNDSRFARYAEGLVKKYDKDGNGELSSDEQSGISSTFSGADADENGILTVEEVTKAIQKRFNSD